MIESSSFNCSCLRNAFLPALAFIVLPSVQIKFKSIKSYLDAKFIVSLNASFTKDALFFLNLAIVLKFG